MVNSYVNKIHYAKTLDNLHNTDWTGWIDNHKESNIDELYNSFHSLFQSKIVWEKKNANRKKPIQPWMTFDILSKKRKMDIQLPSSILGQSDYPVSRFGLYSPNHLS